MCPDRPPQFNATHACAACPFRADSTLRVSPPHLREIVQSLHERHPFGCHKTTVERGRDLNHPQARYCVGALRFTEAQGIPGLHTLLARARRMWHPGELNTQAPVFASEDELLAFHADGWPELDPGEAPCRADPS